MKSTLNATKALSDIQRVRIVMLLQGGELCVCQIVEVLKLASSTVSKHLSILENAGLIDSRKEGRWMHYRLPEKKKADFVRPVMTWIVDALEGDACVRQDARRLKRILESDPEVICRRQRKRG